MRRDGRSHDSKGMYRSRDEVAALKNAVLNSWCAGSALKTISEDLAVTIDYAHAIIRRARATGDGRAARRYEDCGAWGPSREQPRGEIVWNLHIEGADYKQIAATLGIKPNTVAAHLTRGRRKHAA